MSCSETKNLCGLLEDVVLLSYSVALGAVSSVASSSPFQSVLTTNFHKPMQLEHNSVSCHPSEPE